MNDKELGLGLFYEFGFVLYPHALVVMSILSIEECTVDQLVEKIRQETERDVPKDRIVKVLERLEKKGVVERHGDRYVMTERGRWLYELVVKPLYETLKRAKPEIFRRLEAYVEVMLQKVMMYGDPNDPETKKLIEEIKKFKRKISHCKKCLEKLAKLTNQ